MKRVFLTVFAVLLFSACTKKPVAMNEYNPGINTNTAAVAVITPEMIKEVKERRAKYLREHGDL